MKKINFLSTLPPTQQRNITAWYRTSWCLFIVLIFGIGTTQIKQVISLRATMQEHRMSAQSYTSTKEVLDKIDCLKVQEKKTGDHHIFIATLKAQQKKTVEYLRALTKATVANNLVVESIMEKNNMMELSISCANSQQALALTTKIIQLPHLQTVRLVSLQPNSGKINAVLATLKGRI
jgi:hypothetical protein